MGVAVGGGCWSLVQALRDRGRAIVSGAGVTGFGPVVGNGVGRVGSPEAMDDSSQSGRIVRARWWYGGQWAGFWFLVGLVAGAGLNEALLFGALPGLVVGALLCRSVLYVLINPPRYW